MGKREWCFIFFLFEELPAWPKKDNSGLKGSQKKTTSLISQNCRFGFQKKHESSRKKPICNGWDGYIIDRDIWVLGKFDVGLWFRGIWEQADSTRRTVSFGKSRLKIPRVKRMYSEVTSSETKKCQYFQPQPQMFLANLTPSFPILPSGPDLSPDIFSLPRKSRPPMGAWGKGEGLWRWACDRQQRDLLHQWWRTSGSQQNNLSIYKLMDGTSLKANRYLFLYRCFLFVNFHKWADVKEQLWL